jgi:hypothetical protein
MAAIDPLSKDQPPANAHIIEPVNISWKLILRRRRDKSRLLRTTGSNSTT